MDLLDKREAEKLLSKVPEVTVYFWIIKVLCTTVGETAADFLNMSLGLGLSGTSVVMGVLLAIALILQYRAKRYIPSVYWMTVVLVSVFGTLVTDNLTDKLNVPLEVSTVVFSIALAVTFTVWYASEKTLSIHSIFTVRRESFYWLAILFTFALGTAAGDLMAEGLQLGYLNTGIIVCSAIIATFVAWYLGLDAVLSFWIVYIMTRPLGASLGDLMSQSHASGGLGFGPTVTSVIFLSAILVTVIFLTITRRDMIGVADCKSDELVTATTPKAAFVQTAFVLALVLALSWGGYLWRRIELQVAVAAETSQSIGEAGALATALQPLGDLSSFRSIASGTLDLVNSGKLGDAKTRVGDLESAWDQAAGKLKRMNGEKWTELDTSIDSVLRNLRAFHQDKGSCESSLQSLITEIDNLDNRTVTK